MTDSLIVSLVCLLCQNVSSRRAGTCSHSNTQNGTWHTAHSKYVATWQSRRLKWVVLSSASCKLLLDFLTVFKENLEIPTLL